MKYLDVYDTFTLRFIDVAKNLALWHPFGSKEYPNLRQQDGKNYKNKNKKL